MAPECFCGCGRRVRFSRRTQNSSGLKVQSELEWWEAYREAVDQTGAELPDTVLDFLSDGLWLHDNLAALVHDEDQIDAGFDTRKVTRWLKFSQTSRRKIRSDLASRR